MMSVHTYWRAIALSCAIFCATLSLSDHARADESHGDEAAVLREVSQKIAASQWREAVDLLQNPSVSPFRRELLLGYIALEVNQPERALEFLERARELEPEREEVLLYKGRAHLLLEQWSSASAALEKIENASLKTSTYYVMLSRARRQEGRLEGAWSTLRDGLAAHGKQQLPSVQLSREVILVAMSVGLRALVVPMLDDYVSHPEVVASDVIYVSDVMRRIGWHEMAVNMLEAALARFPEQRAELLPLLAYNDAMLGRAAVAARRFELAAYTDPSWHFEAADQWRVAGWTNRALRQNNFVKDREKRLAQRFLILFEAARWERALSLRAHFDTEQNDPMTTYRIAIAAVRVGDEVLAPRLIAKLPEQSPWSERAEQLRQDLRVCGDAPWRCL